MMDTVSGDAPSFHVVSVSGTEWGWHGQLGIVMSGDATL